MRGLAILGGSGHGKVVADAALAAGWETITFFDDAWPARMENGRWQIRGGTAELYQTLDEFDGVIVAIGHSRVRLERLRALEDLGANLVTVVHPAACVSRFAAIGIGVVIMAGVVVNVDCVVGDAVILNTGSTIDHDCRLEDGVHISPGAHLAGNVAVHQCSWVGIGSSVRQGITIGRDSIIGAGAVVVADVGMGLTVVGSPARPMGI